MAKFYGAIGYIEERVETKPGVWSDQIVEFNYSGDLIKNTRKLQSANKMNDDVTLANDISIIADKYSYENFLNMKYVVYMGTKWEVASVDASCYPRLLLTLGGVYNGE